MMVENKEKYEIVLSYSFSFIKNEILYFIEDLMKKEDLNIDKNNKKIMYDLFYKLNHVYSTPDDKEVSLALDEILFTFKSFNLDLKTFSKIERLQQFILIGFDNVSDKDFDSLFDVFKVKDNNNLSEWIVVHDYCATRVYEGTDFNDPINRVAFIEKTPRIRLTPYINDKKEYTNWFHGNKGNSGADGHIPENQLYGYDPDSREFCDWLLERIGYKLN